MIQARQATPPTLRRFGRLASALLAVVALGGCVSLFPKAKPTQLYRFGWAVSGPTVIAQPGAGAPQPRPVALAPVVFDPASASDRLLTVTGPKAAYISDARWLAPARDLFAEAIRDAFEARSTSVRLTGKGDITPAALLMSVDVREFEIRYPAEGAPPTVHMVAAFRLSRYADRTPVGEHVFQADAPAQENRLVAIVAAYQQAVQTILADSTVWADPLAAAEPMPGSDTPTVPTRIWGDDRPHKR